MKSGVGADAARIRRNACAGVLMLQTEEIITVGQIRENLERLGGYNSILIPEFTWDGLRIDAAVVDLSSRWIRGFEIKMSRSDYNRDTKWILYSQFCSSLSIACPWGLIKKDEVDSPFGLLWVKPGNFLHWEKKPKNIQKRNGMAWLWTYMKVIERELPRIHFSERQLRSRLEWEINRK